MAHARKAKRNLVCRSMIVPHKRESQKLEALGPGDAGDVEPERIAQDATLVGGWVKGDR
jgi:hypothetical protein